jgi:hypothetical protein
MIAGACTPSATTQVAATPATQQTVASQIPGIPNRPDLVTAVPFYWKPNETDEEQTKVVIPAEVDGHHGIFIVDIGAPPFFLNRTFLQPSPTGGTDTVTDANRIPDTAGERPRTWDKVRVMVRIGTLLDTVTDQVMTRLMKGSNPHHFNAFLNHYWGNFGWNFSPRLGNIGPSVLEPFETIIDYTHRRVVLIRLDSAGHRLVAVPAYKPIWSTPLVDVERYQDGQQFWGIAVRPDNTLDTLNVAENTQTKVMDTGAPGDGELLGYPFLSHLGVVGFNHRTHQFILYR